MRSLPSESKRSDRTESATLKSSSMSGVDEKLALQPVGQILLVLHINSARLKLSNKTSVRHESFG